MACLISQNVLLSGGPFVNRKLACRWQTRLVGARSPISGDRLRTHKLSFRFFSVMGFSKDLGQTDEPLRLLPNEPARRLLLSALCSLVPAPFCLLAALRSPLPAR